MKLTALVCTVSLVAPCSAKWSTDTLSVARSALAATAVGNVALFAGGRDPSYSDVVDIFDALTRTWSTTSLSQARYFPVATAAGGSRSLPAGWRSPTGPTASTSTTRLRGDFANTSNCSDWETYSPTGFTIHITVFEDDDTVIGGSRPDWEDAVFTIHDAWYGHENEASSAGSIDFGWHHKARFIIEEE